MGERCPIHTEVLIRSTRRLPGKRPPDWPHRRRRYQTGLGDHRGAARPRPASSSPTRFGRRSRSFLECLAVKGVGPSEPSVGRVRVPTT